MSIGFVLLVHENLDRVAQLVAALHRMGCKLAIHVDAKVPESEYMAFRQVVDGLESVVLAPRLHCEWGRFSLVEAQFRAVECLLAGFPCVSHITLLSGSCLPSRPLGEFITFLQQNPDTDYIESVRVGDKTWIKGGLESERLSLYFPFSFVRNRRIFDLFVELQRKLGIKRKMPSGLTPHIGSQWWTLTRATLSAILKDPQRPVYDRYFKKCWIPDESYFQTLARKHSQNLKSRSLTFTRFDFRGKPMMFYDDHLRFIEHIDSYFIRKTWCGAKALYTTLLDPDRQAARRNPDMETAFLATIEKAENRRIKGRQGLVMQGQVPRLTEQVAAAPYTVLSGFDHVFQDFPDWIKQETGLEYFQHLFSRQRKPYQELAPRLKGNLGGSPRLRNHNPEGFLLNFIWNQRDDDPLFALDPGKNQRLARFIARDPKARVFFIRSVWLLRLFRNNERDIQALQSKISLRLRQEQAQLSALLSGNAKVKIISLNEILSQPGAVLEELVFELRPSLAQKNRDLPVLLPREGLEEYIEFLRDAGLNWHREAENSPDIVENSYE